MVWVAVRGCCYVLNIYIYIYIYVKIVAMTGCEWLSGFRKKIWRQIQKFLLRPWGPVWTPSHVDEMCRSHAHNNFWRTPYFSHYYWAIISQSSFCSVVSKGKWPPGLEFCDEICVLLCYSASIEQQTSQGSLCSILKKYNNECLFLYKGQ